MISWQKYVIGLAMLIGLSLVGCAPTTEAIETLEPTQEATSDRTNLEALSPAQEGIEIIEEVDSVAATKDPTRELVVPTKEIVEEEMTPTSESSSSSSQNPKNVYVETAVSDLAQRLNVPEAEIQIVSYENVVWPDSSMGCPQPDMMYTQVLREGYKITLNHDGKTYYYHGGEGRDPFLCEKQRDNKTIIPPPNMDE